MAAPILTAFGLTDVGLVRTNNEDNFLIADSLRGVGQTGTEVFADNGGILLVADGMGGLQAGEVASRMAVELVAETFLKGMQHRAVSQEHLVKTLKSSIQEANQQIFHEGQKHKGMGTTLTAAVVHGAAIFFAQLGDSRAYLLRNHALVQMTRDQTLVAQLLAAGSITPQEAKVHPKRNTVLQAMGIQPTVEIPVSFTDLRHADKIVLCSDGLWGKVEDEEIKVSVENHQPREACQALIELARERGGEDNITVIVASCVGKQLPMADSTDLPDYRTFEESPRSRFWPWRRR